MKGKHSWDADAPAPKETLTAAHRARHNAGRDRNSRAGTAAKDAGDRAAFKRAMRQAERDADALWHGPSASVAPKDRPGYRETCPARYYSRLKHGTGHPGAPRAGVRELMTEFIPRGLGSSRRADHRKSGRPNSNVRTRPWRPGEAGRIVRYVSRERALARADGLASDRAPDPGTILSSLGDTVEERATAMEALEDLERKARANAQVYMHVIVGLPAALSYGERVALLAAVVRPLDRLELGYVAALHAPDADGDQRNHHAHLIVSLRPIRRHGPYVWEFAPTKQTWLNTPRGLKLARAHIAREINRALRGAGLDERWTARSRADRGVAAQQQNTKRGRGEVYQERAKVAAAREVAAAKDQEAAIARATAMVERLGDLVECGTALAERTDALVAAARDHLTTLRTRARDTATTTHALAQDAAAARQQAADRVEAARRRAVDLAERSREMSHEAAGVVAGARQRVGELAARARAGTDHARGLLANAVRLQMEAARMEAARAQLAVRADRARLNAMSERLASAAPRAHARAEVALGDTMDRAWPRVAEAAARQLAADLGRNVESAIARQDRGLTLDTRLHPLAPRLIAVFARESAFSDALAAALDTAVAKREAREAQVARAVAAAVARVIATTGWVGRGETASGFVADDPELGRLLARPLPPVETERLAAHAHRCAAMMDRVRRLAGDDVVELCLGPSGQITPVIDRPDAEQAALVQTVTTWSVGPDLLRELHLEQLERRERDRERAIDLAIAALARDGACVEADAAEPGRFVIDGVRHAVLDGSLPPLAVARLNVEAERTRYDIEEVCGLVLNGRLALPHSDGPLQLGYDDPYSGPVVARVTAWPSWPARAAALREELARAAEPPTRFERLGAAAEVDTSGAGTVPSDKAPGRSRGLLGRIAERARQALGGSRAGPSVPETSAILRPSPDLLKEIAWARKTMPAALVPAFDRVLDAVHDGALTIERCSTPNPQWREGSVQARAYADLRFRGEPAMLADVTAIERDVLAGLILTHLSEECHGRPRSGAVPWPQSVTRVELLAARGEFNRPAPPVVRRETWGASKFDPPSIGGHTVERSRERRMPTIEEPSPQVGARRRGSTPKQSDGTGASATERCECHRGPRPVGREQRSQRRLLERGGVLLKLRVGGLKVLLGVVARGAVGGGGNVQHPAQLGRLRPGGLPPAQSRARARA